MQRGRCSSRDVPTLSNSCSLPHLTIQDLIVELVKIQGVNMVKLKSRDAYLYMKSSTILFIFELEHCVNHVYFELCKNTYEVNEKFKKFVTYLRQNCVANRFDAANILRKIYDKNSNVECELIAYALDNIVYNAFHE